jgi:hypothetical protein
MPMPPPPAVLFNITGYPMMAALSSAKSRSGSRSVPGSRGTIAFCASALAVCLRPNSRIWPGVGPMKVIPAAAQASANPAFSLTKP